MTPEAKEKRFLKLKEKRKKQKENKKLGKETKDGEKPKSEEGKAEVPEKSAESSPGKVMGVDVFLSFWVFGHCQKRTRVRVDVFKPLFR